MINMVNMIRDFNKTRNSFKLDMKLEVDMLKEEIQEYFNANTLAERIDAYIDTQYVYQGTKMKCAYNGFRLNPEVKEWIENSLDLMERDLKVELGTKYGIIIEKATKIVCNINAFKTKDLDENGKVIKPANLVNATDEIRKVLDETL